LSPARTAHKPDRHCHASAALAAQSPLAIAGNALAATADIDGDGRGDTVRLLSPGLGTPSVLQITLASGRVLTAPAGDGLPPARLLRIANVDGRRGAEIFVDTQHISTEDTVSIYTDRARNLAVAERLPAFGGDFGIKFAFNCTRQGVRAIVQHQFLLDHGRWSRTDTTYVWHNGRLHRQGPSRTAPLPASPPRPQLRREPPIVVWLGSLRTYEAASGAGPRRRQTRLIATAATGARLVGGRERTWHASAPATPTPARVNLTMFTSASSTIGARSTRAATIRPFVSASFARRRNASEAGIASACGRARSRGSARDASAAQRSATARALRSATRVSPTSTTVAGPSCSIFYHSAITRSHGDAVWSRHPTKL
jgi:hypothetical protein